MSSRSSTNEYIEAYWERRVCYRPSWEDYEDKIKVNLDPNRWKNLPAAVLQQPLSPPPKKNSSSAVDTRLIQRHLNKKVDKLASVIDKYLEGGWWEFYMFADMD